MKNVLTFIFSICTVFFIHGQTIMPPIIDSVSVDPGTGNIIIGWHDDNTSGVNDYIITRLYYKTNPDHPPRERIDTIPSNTVYIYTDASINASEGAVGYSIFIIYGEFSTIHKTIFLRSQYDSCNASIQLSWSAYEGWESIREYQIIDYTTKNILGTTSDTLFTLNNIQTEQIYNIYVRAIGPINLTSSSNLAIINTDRPDPPSFIEPQEILANEDVLNINLHIDPHSEINRFVLFKSDNISMENSLVIDTLVELSNNIIYADSNFNSNNISYYQISAIDGCMHQVFNSQPFFNIVSKLSQDGDLVKLDYSDGNVWQTDNISYTIYRSDEFESFSNIYNTTERYYTDDISNLMGQNFNTQICYYIEAVNRYNNFTNVSKQTCINLEPIIFTPSSFNPNSSVNNYFLPVFSFLPTDYELTIINKTGNIVFSSTDPSEKWHGQNMPSGTYLYTLKYKIDGKKKSTKSGIVNLFKTN